VRYLLLLGAVVVLSANVAPSPASECGARHAMASCVRPLNAAESAALDAAVHRLHQGDTDECRALGAFVRDHRRDARIVPYPIRTPFGIATGDAHLVEDPRGTGRVHVADSIITGNGALERPLSAKVRSLLHDFAHIALELPQSSIYLSTDAADDALARCIDGESE
jgi:hypothetical protein